MKSTTDYINYHCPRWNELPDIELYADQVLSVVQKHVSFFSEEIDMTFTSNMINNYVKQKIVKPPINKKYDRVHLAYFTVVCLLKRFLSINEICMGISYLMNSASVSELYDIFCEELEGAIKAHFDPQNFPSRFSKDDSAQIKIIRGVANTFAGLAYVKFTMNSSAIEN